jgi:hypothetical protein
MTARIANKIPNPCFMVMASFKNTIAKITLKIGYNDESGAMIVTGPFETASRKQRAPTKPNRPAIEARTIPLGCVSRRKFMKTNTMIARKRPPITSYIIALFGSMYFVVILGI